MKLLASLKANYTREDSLCSTYHAQLFLILRHLLQHLWQIFDVGLQNNRLNKDICTVQDGVPTGPCRVARLTLSVHILLLSQKDRSSSVTFLQKWETHWDQSDIWKEHLDQSRGIWCWWRTHFVTSAMCMCRNCIQSSSSSSSSTSLSFALPMPVVWYLGMRT